MCKQQSMASEEAQLRPALGPLVDLHRSSAAALALLELLLDTGYPDSTHFSHSIRQVYGLKPKDIFAGSRRLAIYAQIAHA
jgi:AraC-like DNA-binding protein